MRLLSDFIYAPCIPVNRLLMRLWGVAYVASVAASTLISVWYSGGRAGIVSGYVDFLDQPLPGNVVYAFRVANLIK